MEKVKIKTSSAWYRNSRFPKARLENIVLSVVLVVIFVSQTQNAGILSRSKEQGVYNQQNLQSENWVLQLRNYSRRVHSQKGQDGIIEEIFNHVKARNKQYVEFGFGYASGVSRIRKALQGTNTFYLSKKGWKGWMFDALLEYRPIGLYKELLTPEAIVEIFKKHSIPTDVDYVSIDVDSIDIWLLHHLIKDKIYSPQLISIEYNSNFPYNSTVTCDNIWKPWAGDFIYGASIGAILHVAKQAGYFPVHVEDRLDIFLVNKASLQKSNGKGLTLQQLEQFFPLPRIAHRFRSHASLDRLVDYVTYEKTGDMELARLAAERDRESIRRLHRISKPSIYL